MPFVKINQEKLWEGLNKLLDLAEIKEQIQSLKGLKFGIEFISIIANLFGLAIKTVEEICLEAGEVGVGADKKKAVVKFLDGIIQLPFYLEFFDGPIIGVIVDIVVAWIFPKRN